jgi:hypothetical protein
MAVTELDDAITTCVRTCMADVDARIATETDPDTRALLAEARPMLEALVRERCAVGLREAWARHTATLH